MQATKPRFIRWDVFSTKLIKIVGWNNCYFWIQIIDYNYHIRFPHLGKPETEERCLVFINSERGCLCRTELWIRVNQSQWAPVALVWGLERQTEERKKGWISLPFQHCITDVLLDPDRRVGVQEPCTWSVQELDPQWFGRALHVLSPSCSTPWGAIMQRCTNATSFDCLLMWNESFIRHG